MNIIDIIEAAISNGVVTEMDSRVLTTDAERVVEIDWDAYPHASELV